jgi:hypothetical protein
MPDTTAAAARYKVFQMIRLLKVTATARSSSTSSMLDTTAATGAAAAVQAAVTQQNFST